MRSLATCLALGLSAGAFAQPLPVTTADKAGFSAEGLARIDAFFAREIAADRVPGAVVAIARDGKLVHYKAYGFLDKGAGKPMPLDAMFNLASMTKIMASVGALTLNEEGRLPLKSRLDEYLPEFKDVKVGVVSPAGEVTLEAPRQPIFIHDLMRHTSGFTYGNANHPVRKQYPGAFDATDTPGPEFLDKIARAPLVNQPGTIFEYGVSADVLGFVIEKISGQRLGEFLKVRIWDKVGMKDTMFVVPESRMARLAQPLPVDPISGKPQAIKILKTQSKFDCAGACAFGTVGDFLRFGQMLVNGGTIDGKRVLSPKTVAFMTSNHLTASIKNNVPLVEPHRDGYSFGLGVAVRGFDGVAATPGTAGDYSWNGANGTSFWADPKEKLVVVVGTVAPGDIRKYYREQMGALVYGAMSRLK
ncbi:MAG TPA: serine hydrolase domain-containing protein [Usitatibacteraceae bacterium]|nr:serine hydrolase domain-containing protein [Usitatibacteraceae bacterium]